MEKMNSTPVTEYREVTIGRTIYRVTNVYMGEVDLKEELEELTIRNILNKTEGVLGEGETV